MKIRILNIATLILSVLFFNGCKSTKNLTIDDTNDQASLVVSFYQTPGFSPMAPEYTIEVYSNKQMFLTAKKNLDIEGRFMRTLNQNEFDQIINAFISSSFFQFKDEYSSNITDLPTRYVYFANNGKSKKIKDYYGAPEDLKDLELMLQSYLDRAGWIKMTW